MKTYPVSEKKVFNTKIFFPSLTKNGGCEMEIFNFLCLIWDNYLPKAPTKNNRPPLGLDTCSHSYTLIQFAKFSAKILLMVKLLQNYSNLNYLEYSRHLKARKVEKRPNNFLKAKQRPEVEKPKFS